MSKYKVGDKVKIVNYGHLMWSHKKMSFPVVSEDGGIVWMDMSAELVGQEGVVNKITITQGNPEYGIDGIKGKCAWYNENQLEKL